MFSGRIFLIEQCFIVSHEMSPEGRAPSIEREVMSFLVTVTQESAKPINKKQTSIIIFINPMHNRGGIK